MGIQKASDYYDVSLGCPDSNGKSLQAHKVVISAFSSVFKDIINQAASVSSKINPFVYFRGVSHLDLSSILDFIYQGVVCINEERAASFLSVAEDLKIEGLSTIRISVNEGNKDPIKATQNIDVTHDVNKNESLTELQESELEGDVNSSFAHDRVDAKNENKLKPKIESGDNIRKKIRVDGKKQKEHKNIEWNDLSLSINDYEIIEGKRKGATIYKKDDFGYLLQNEDKSGKLYLKCVERNKLNQSSDCHGRAIISDDKLEITKEHNHHPSKMYFQINAMENRMKRRALETNESLRKIFDEECLLDSETATHMSFKAMKGSMEKRRRSVTYPKEAYK